jgi:hypothetical protein
MLRSPLRNLQRSLETLNDEKELKVTTSILTDVASDLIKNSSLMVGDEGYIDYYSPNATAQMEHQQLIFEKYLTQLSLLKAVLIIINKKTKEEKAIMSDPNLSEVTKQKKLKAIKKSIDRISQNTEPLVLLERTDINTEVTRINSIEAIKIKITELTTQLKRDDEATINNKIMINKRQELEQKINDYTKQVTEYNNEVNDIPKFDILEKRQNELRLRLTKHLTLKEQIPEGMLDVKRALSFNQELRKAQKSLDSKRTELRALPDRGSQASKLSIKIEELEVQLKLIPLTKFSSSGKDNEKIVLMLDDLRRLMATSIKGYQDLVVSGGEINAFYHKTTGFYWENLYLYRETLAGINSYLQESPLLTPEGKLVAKCLDMAFKVIPKKEEINDALTYVKAVDLNLSQRANTYNKNVGENPVRFYKGSAASFVDFILQEEVPKPFFFIPYNANSYVLDQPAHLDLVSALGNCYGETQMFLQRINGSNPTLNNICPERELMNFQLDQSRKIGDISKSVGEYNSELAPQTSGPKEFVRWNSIKHFLTSPADSSKHGDICFLRLEGARSPDNDKDIAHAIGFIKMKNPSPYKYVVYDYNLGAMGFSDDRQLEAFFKKIFEGNDAYYPYSRCVLEKVAEVSDECQQFINGPHGVKSLEKIPPEKAYKRDYWNKSRLDLLAKSSPDLHIILGLINNDDTGLSESDKSDLYETLCLRSDFDLETYLQLAIAEKQWPLLEYILKRESQTSYSSIATLNLKDLSKEITNLVENGTVNPALAAKCFPTNRIIILEAYKKEPSSIKYADKSLFEMLSKDKEINTVEVLRFVEQPVVEEWIKEGRVTFQDALTAFPDDPNFKLGVEYERTLSSLNLSEPLAKNENEKQSWSESLNRMSIFFRKYHSPIKPELEAAIRNLCQVLITDVEFLNDGLVTSQMKEVVSKFNLMKLEDSELINLMTQLGDTKIELILQKQIELETKQQQEALAAELEVKQQEAVAAELEIKQQQEALAAELEVKQEQEAIAAESENDRPTSSPNSIEKSISPPIYKPIETTVETISDTVIVDPIHIKEVESNQMMQEVVAVSEDSAVQEETPVAIIPISVSITNLPDEALLEARNLLVKINVFVENDTLLPQYISDISKKINPSVSKDELSKITHDLKMLLGVTTVVHTLASALTYNSAWYMRDDTNKGVSINTAFKCTPVGDRLELVKMQKAHKVDSGEFSNCNQFLNALSEQRAKWRIFKSNETTSFKSFKEKMTVIREEVKEKSPLVTPKNLTSYLKK